MTEGYIARGFSCRIRLEYVPPEGDPGAAVPFPAGVQLRAELRERAGASVLATLTTGGGSIVRESDWAVRLEIPAAASVDWAPTLRTVLTDLVRTDTTPDTYVGPILEIPVVAPITASTDAGA